MEIDLPAIIEDKQATLANERSVCRLEQLGLDLADRSARQSVLARLGSEGERVLILAEELLLYLDDADVAALADDLRAAFANGIWLTENVAPSILHRHEKLFGEQLRAAHAEHKFAPRSGWEFLRSHGWKLDATKSLFEEGRRLGREPMGQKLMRWLTPHRYAWSTRL